MSKYSLPPSHPPTFFFQTILNIFRLTLSHCQVLTVNFLSHVKIAKLLLPSMLSRESGHIVNTTSITGRVGFLKRTAYSASKHAVMGYFDALRLELYHTGVLITNACPGPVQVIHYASLFSGSLHHQVFFFQTDVDKNALMGSGLKSGLEDPINRAGITAPRCAQLMLAGTSAKLPELWIAEGQAKLLFYVASYLPLWVLHAALAPQIPTLQQMKTKSN